MIEVLRMTVEELSQCNIKSHIDIRIVSLDLTVQSGSIRLPWIITGRLIPNSVIKQTLVCVVILGYIMKV